VYVCRGLLTGCGGEISSNKSKQCGRVISLENRREKETERRIGNETKLQREREKAGRDREIGRKREQRREKGKERQIDNKKKQSDQQRGKRVDQRVDTERPREREKDGRDREIG